MRRKNFIKHLEQVEAAKNSAMDVILRKNKRNVPLMNNRRFAEYVNTVMKNQDPTGMGDELLRLELINNNVGYVLPENVRIQKMEAINPKNDRVRKLAVTPSLNSSINNLNLNLTSGPSRQLNIEYQKFQFLIDVASQNNLTGYIGKYILVVDMDNNFYSMTTLEDINKLTGEFKGFKNDIQIFLRSTFISRSVICLYVPSPDTVTDKLNLVCKKIALPLLLQGIKERSEASSASSTALSAYSAVGRGARLPEKLVPTLDPTIPRITVGEEFSGDLDAAINQKLLKDVVTEFENIYYTRLNTPEVKKLIGQYIIVKKRYDAEYPKLKKEYDSISGKYKYAMSDVILQKEIDDLNKINNKLKKDGKPLQYLDINGIVVKNSNKIVKNINAVREKYASSIKNELKNEPVKKSFDDLRKKFKSDILSITDSLERLDRDESIIIKNELISKYKLNTNKEVLAKFEIYIGKIIKESLDRIEKELKI